MPRKKIRLTLVANENKRATSLRKRKLGLVKKVRELTILCDVKACLIIFSPNDAEPMVWPSVEAARDLLDDYFALPEFEKKQNETTLESYLKEKTRKVHEQLTEIKKKNTEQVIDQLMVQLSSGRRMDDLNLSEIYQLLSFLKGAIMNFRKRLSFLQQPPLYDPPMHPFETQSEELIRTNANDVFMVGSGQDYERAENTDEGDKVLSIGTVRENQSYYLMDKW
ncbi:hypothetical protein EUTSA_v10021945mg, partial [Eutrema salsugineum]